MHLPPSLLQTLSGINPDVALESYTMNITTLEGFDAFKASLTKEVGAWAAAAAATATAAASTQASSSGSDSSGLQEAPAARGGSAAARAHPPEQTAPLAPLLWAPGWKLARRFGAELCGQLRGAHDHQPGTRTPAAPPVH